MDKRFDDHAKAAAESREDVRAIRDRLDKGQEMFGQVSTSLVKIESALIESARTQAKHGEYLDEHHKRLSELEADANVRKGERGVWAAIVKSPAAAWLAAIIAAVWAFLTKVSANPPH